MRWSNRLLLPVVLMGGLATVSCAEGLEPPAVTKMADITTGLTFTFGTQPDIEGICSPFNTPLNQQPSCTVNNGVSVPTQWPPIQVELDPFAMDVHEVTNYQYEYCVAAGGCTEPRAGNAQSFDQLEYYGVSTFRDFPIVNVTQEQAAAYCAFVGKRLPSEFEWERVAKGGNSAAPRRFPTENLGTNIEECKSAGFNTGWCRGDQRTNAVTDTTVDFVTEGGVSVFFLFGNAAEWTSTTYDRDVQCAGDPPCKRQEDCVAIATCAPPGEHCLDSGVPVNCPASVQTCYDDATACAQESSFCADCTQPDDCYFMCDGSTPTKRTIVCKPIPAASQPIAGSTLEEDAVGTKKVIRGGSVFLSTDKQTCLYRSSYRDTNLDPTAVQPWLGFRCAKSL